jgi:hypothetical protein
MGNAVIDRAAKRGLRGKLGKPYYTRKEVREILEQEFGVPVSRSALEKLRIAPDRYYGKQGLYGLETIARLAAQLITDHPVNLGLNQPVTDPTPEAA